MKKIICLTMCMSILIGCTGVFALASTDEGLTDKIEDNMQIMGADAPEIDADAAVLMDASTGTLLFSKNASEALPPASVTKIMTLLLVAEALDNSYISLEDQVTVSENAASMGGSQIFLKEGETFTVDELLKSTVIASANDAAVALAELICGSEKAFVDKMNEKAKALGMNNTHFENATGLDDSVVNHKISAFDIALMSKELIKHDEITRYSNIWQDSIRNGEFILTNTNRLVRFYDGCTGLKTGSTDKAGFCVSATAKRGDMHLIAVIMGAETRDERNNAARALLDYGFANFALYSEAEKDLEDVPVRYGMCDQVTLYSDGFSKILGKNYRKEVEKIYNIPENLEAPLKEGDVVGEIVYKIGDETIGKSSIRIKSDVDRIGLSEILWRILKTILIGKEK